MRFIYSVLFYLISPFIFLRLWWRSRKLPDYRQRLGERLGFYPIKLDKSIWVHAVSVGETIAAIPLIKTLQQRYPHLPIVVTTMTPTGALRVKSAFGDSVIHLYLPYDFNGAVKRFLKAIHPVIGIIMETELWPNLLAQCAKEKIPVCLVNARLSEKSARGYQRIKSLTQEMLLNLTAIAANGEPDANRFIALGANPQTLEITGNIKFDLQLPADLINKAQALRAELGNDRLVWIAASTHEGEEEIILAAHEKIKQQCPQALLLLVPRHPDRFDAVAAMCQKAFVTCRRSLKEPCTPETAVYLGDTMGELLLLYAASDVTFVGGSLIPRGGHNMLEPGALEKPVITGPHLFNFAEISALFINAQALLKVNDADTLAQIVLTLKNDTALRAAMGARGKGVLDANRGALDRQLMIISRYIVI